MAINKGVLELEKKSDIFATFFWQKKGRRLSTSHFLTKPAEDLKNNNRLNKLHAIVNGTYFQNYTEYQKYILFNKCGHK